MLKLYVGPLSLFSRKVEIALREKGIPYHREFVAFTQEKGYEPRHPAVLAANPKRQVPVLVDGDLALFDSTVILEYLEDLYPQPPLYPVTAGDRALCRLIELDADEILFAPVRYLLFRTEPPHPDPVRHAEHVAAGKAAEAAIDIRFAELDRKLNGSGFFNGDAVTIADIAMFMTILFTQRLRGPSLGRYEMLGGWYRRMLSRPAFAAAADEIAGADQELSPALAC
jgi:glutathione S-transferase